MVESYILPEVKVSGISMLSDDKYIFVSAKNGDRLSVIKGDLLNSWEKMAEFVYFEKPIPVIFRLKDDLGVFLSRRYIPYVKGLNRKVLSSLITPFLKKAVVSSHPIRVNQKFLLPVYGVPYGCKLVSPALFESEDGYQWYFKNFIILSEDFGLELRNVRLLEKDGIIYAFIGSSFPFFHIFVSESTDCGETWSIPKATGIFGLYPVSLVLGGRIYLVSYSKDGNKVNFYIKTNSAWDLVYFLSLKEEVIDMDACLVEKELVLGVVFRSGRAELLKINNL